MTEQCGADYSCYVTDVKTAFGTEHAIATFNKLYKTHLVHTYDKWDAEDLKALHEADGYPLYLLIHKFAQQAATNENNVDQIIKNTITNTLNNPKSTPQQLAVVQDKDFPAALRKQLLEKSKYAQDALEQIKPESCASWYQYADMILKVDKEFQHANYVQPSSMFDHFQSPNLKQTQLSAFNPQDALASLDEALVQGKKLTNAALVVDETHDHQAPLKTLVTDAVKGMKTTLQVA